MQTLLDLSTQPRLRAGRCADCGTVSFPRPTGCPRCTGTSIREHLLPSDGTLWSWTIQRFLPKDPYIGDESSVPYGVGYVEFPGECIVEGRLTVADPAALRLGMAMRTTTTQVAGRDGAPPMTLYAFEPAVLDPPEVAR